MIFNSGLFLFTSLYLDPLLIPEFTANMKFFFYSKYGVLDALGVSLNYLRNKWEYLLIIYVINIIECTRIGLKQNYYYHSFKKK